MEIIKRNIDIPKINSIRKKKDEKYADPRCNIYTLVPQTFWTRHFLRRMKIVGGDFTCDEHPLLKEFTLEPRFAPNFSTIISRIRSTIWLLYSRYSSYELFFENRHDRNN